MAEKKEVIILGIDPGTAITGYGVLVFSKGKMKALDYGCIRTSPKACSAARQLKIFQGVSELVTLYNPEAMAIETQFVHKNSASALTLGMARGVATLAASLRAIPVYEYAPTRAKKAVVGKGNASKQQVQGMIRSLLALTALPEPEDAADALALAICHAHTIGSRHV